MKNFKKVYIGKGSQPKAGLDILKITLKYDQLAELVHEYEGNRLITVEVARLKEPDAYGRTHTVYAQVLAEEEVTA